jgi:hypothetical protein
MKSLPAPAKQWAENRIIIVNGLVFIFLPEGPGSVVWVERVQNADLGCDPV